MYQWRKMTETEREEALAERKAAGHPWHSPPHFHTEGVSRYLFTAACYEHKPHIGRDRCRMNEFEWRLLEVAAAACDSVVAWVILPNHYHFLAITEDAKTVLKALGRLHGRTSFDWNGEEATRGRQVWFNAAETAMKSDRHYWATINYIHHNPVKHRYSDQWQDWPWCSCHQYLEKVGMDEAERVWREFPVDEYGKDWDEMEQSDQVTMLSKGESR